MPRPLPTALGAGCVTAGLILAACATEPTGSLNPATSTLPVPREVTWAMTGLPGPAGKVGTPVLAVKIDNTKAARPQSGVGAADLVIQEPVEGGATRLAAFYESKSPKRVGPVRSIRTSDVGLVKPVRATLVASGGAQVVLRTMASANVTVIDESNPSLTRDSSRPAPYNVYADVRGLQEHSIGKSPQQPYFVFGTQTASQGRAAKAVTVLSSNLSVETWTYSKKTETWNRAGGQFAARNLLMLRVELGDAGYQDPAGNPVPEVVTTGSGKGWLAAGGSIHKVLWSKSQPDSAYELTMPGGESVELTPGKSWVSLLPKGTSSVSYN